MLDEAKKELQEAVARMHQAELMMVEVRKKSPLRERLTKRQLEVRDEEDVLLKLVKILADEARPRPNAVPKRLSSRWIYVAWSVMFIYYVF